MGVKYILSLNIWVSNILHDASEEIHAFFKRKSRPPILGSREFVDNIRKGHFKDVVYHEVNKREIPTLGTETIIKAVAAEFKLKTDAITTHRRGRQNTPRDVAIYLVRKETRKTLPEIGVQFGISNYSSVSCCIDRVNKQLAMDKAFDRKIKRVIDNLD